MTENQKIANTILEQLGGRRFTVMTGAKDYVAVARGLQMKINRGQTLTITLNGNDLYDITLRSVQRMRKDFTMAGGNLLKEETDIFVSDLRKTFTAMTGLYTSL